MRSAPRSSTTKNALFARYTTLKGDQTVISGTLNAKYYFRSYEAGCIPSWGWDRLRRASYGGDFTGRRAASRSRAWRAQTSGSATASACTSNSSCSTPRSRDKNQQEFKAGGNGILAGLSFVF